MLPYSALLFIFLANSVISGQSRNGCSNNGTTQRISQYDPKEFLPANSSFKYRITLCAMTHNTMPYLVEWIFFHFIQGVRHFIIFDDSSDDDITLLPHLFDANGFPDLIEILPANFLRQSLGRSPEISEHTGRQLDLLDYCTLRTANISEWLLICDTDEYLYTMKDKNIPEFIDNYKTNYKKSDISQFSFPIVRFGTSGTEKNIHGYISRSTDGKTVELYYEPDPNGTLIYPLTTERSNHRGPFPDLDEDYEELYQRICVKNAHDCQHAIGKSMYRPRNCSYSGVHACRTWSGRSENVNIQDARLAHYAWRSKENVEALDGQWQNTKKNIFKTYDKVWFSFREDNSAKRFADTVRAMILTHFKPIPLVKNNKV